MQPQHNFNNQDSSTNHGQSLNVSGPSSLQEVQELKEFVCTKLPELLTQISTAQGSLRDEVLQLLRNDLFRSESEEILLKGSFEEQRRMQLDLVMLKTALEKDQLDTLGELNSLLSDVSAFTRIPETLTYELIILANEESNMRTFRDGKVGKAEEAFYQGHKKVEESLTCGIENLLQALDILEKPQLELKDNLRLATLIGQFCERMEEVKKAYSTYFLSAKSAFNAQHFAEFRKYLSETPEHPGPSGLFSAQMFAAKLLVLGKEGLEDRIPFIREKLDYYPVEHREKLLKSITRAEAGRSLRDYTKRPGLDESVLAAIEKASQAILDNAKVHRGVVQTNLPEAFEQDMLGTAGQPIKEFLGGGVKNIENSLKKEANSPLGKQNPPLEG